MKVVVIRIRSRSPAGARDNTSPPNLVNELEDSFGLIAAFIEDKDMPSRPRLSTQGRYVLL